MLIEKKIENSLLKRKTQCIFLNKILKSKDQVISRIILS